MSKNGSKTVTRVAAALALALALSDRCPADGPSVEEGRSFWAFQPISDPNPPERVSDPSWQAHPIDAFTLARLDAKHEPRPDELSPERLVRKLYLDLHGLPPTPEQIDQFVSNPTANAYSKLVDQLLSSRRFAERWARHWLSVARYSDSSGGGRAILLHQAWRYRDYVIDSFHHDLPFTDFVTDQIAGDLRDQTDPLARRNSIVASGFLALGPTNYELQDKELLRMDVVDEQIDTIGRAFMGMSLGCARCHDHFFDPVPTADYYALAGIFRSTKTLEHSNVSQWITTDLPPVDDLERKAIDEARAWEDRTAAIRSEIAALKNAAKGNRPKLVGHIVDDNDAVFEGSWTVSTFTAGFVGERYLHDNASAEERRAIFRRRLPVAGEYEVRISYPASSNRTPAASATIKHGNGETVATFDQRERPPIDGFRSLGRFRFTADVPAEVTLTNSSAGKGHLIADAVAFVPVGAIADSAAPPPISSIRQVAELKRKQLEKELKQLQSKRPPGGAYAMSVIDEKNPADYAINIGGNPKNLGEEVERGFLRVASKPGAARPHFASGQSGRLEFAQWLTSPDHPLTARVYTNRTWLWLTGTGIVRTPDDFGAAGDAPSAPLLLDHLATHFLRGGGSTKALVRYIVSSRTYRSPDTKPRRLEAESLRDAMLAVSGELDLAIKSGPAMRKGTVTEVSYRFDSAARSIFTPIFRNNLPELFEFFDFPDPSISQGHRDNTTLPTQALFLMNHPWVLSRAEAAARQLLSLSADDLGQAIDRAYLTTLSRNPSDEEIRLSAEFLGEAPDLKRWTAFQQSLFASIDFRFY